MVKTFLYAYDPIVGKKCTHSLIKRGNQYGTKTYAVSIISGNSFVYKETRD